MAVGSFVSVGRSLDTAIERVKLAEQVGYESVYVTHIAGHDALTILAAYACHTERVLLGTGVVPIYTRTPAAMAQTAASLNAISGGRLVLGLGVSHRPVVEGWHGQTIDKPVAEIKEYVGKVRAILAGEQPEPGGKWPTGFALLPDVRAPDTRVYMAGLSPAMLRAAGEAGDGVVLWLCNPNYIRDVVVPEVTKGRERAGQAAGGLRHRRRRAVGGRRERGRRVRGHAPRPADLLLAAVLPGHDRALRLRRGCRALRRGLRGPRGHGRGDLRRLPADAHRRGRARTRSARACGATRRPERPRPASAPIAKTDFEATLRAAALQAISVAIDAL